MWQPAPGLNKVVIFFPGTTDTTTPELNPLGNHSFAGCLKFPQEYAFVFPSVEFPSRFFRGQRVLHHTLQDSRLGRRQEDAKCEYNLLMAASVPTAVR